MQFSALFTGLAFATSAVAMLPVEIISPAELSVVEVDSVQPVAWTGDNEALGNVTVISLSGGKTSTSMDPCGIIVGKFKHIKKRGSEGEGVDQPVPPLITYLPTPPVR